MIQNTIFNVLQYSTVEINNSDKACKLGLLYLNATWFAFRIIIRLLVSFSFCRYIVALILGTVSVKFPSFSHKCHPAIQSNQPYCDVYQSGNCSYCSCKVNSLKILFSEKEIDVIYCANKDHV